MVKSLKEITDQVGDVYCSAGKPNLGEAAGTAQSKLSSQRLQVVTGGTQVFSSSNSDSDLMGVTSWKLLSSSGVKIVVSTTTSKIISNHQISPWNPQKFEPNLKLPSDQLRSFHGKPSDLRTFSRRIGANHGAMPGPVFQDGRFHHPDATSSPWHGGDRRSRARPKGARGRRFQWDLTKKNGWLVVINGD